MAKIKKKTSVQGIIPAEFVSAELKGKNPAEALYNALAIGSKPEGETEEERKIRIMRRQFICSVFGATADELETRLKQNRDLHQDDGPAVSDMDILSDSEDVAAGQATSNKTNRMIEGFEDAGKYSSFVGAGISVASGLGLETLTVAGTAIALGPIGLVVTGAGAAVGLISFAISKLMKSKIKKGNRSDANEKERAFEEKLANFIKKVEVINSILDSKIDEIMEKKKTMKPKEFTEFKKQIVEEIRQKMEELGLPIAPRVVEGVDLEEEEDEKKKPSKKEDKEDDKEGPNQETPDKKEPKQEEVVDPEKKDIVEMEA